VSRRRQGPRDYASNVTATLLLKQLAAVLQTLSVREATVIAWRFGLQDEIKRSYDEIADHFGISRERVRQIESKAMRKLQHPSRAEVMRDYIDNEVPVPNHVREQLRAQDKLGEPVELWPLIRCDRHGWVESVKGSATCAQCPCPVGVPPDSGRPRQYCDKACRQAAYRQRQRNERERGV
jgi:DNA-binding CsgD family transcriptional regulator